MNTNTNEATATAKANTETGLPVRSPRVDILHEDDCFVILADVPGADENSVDVTLEDGVLTIAARAARETPHGREQVRGEYEAGEYRRSFTLNQQVVDTTQIQASVVDGVLRVTLALAKPTQTVITVQPA